MLADRLVFLCRKARRLDMYTDWFLGPTRVIDTNHGQVLNQLAGVAIAWTISIVGR
jgi:hypothetical protein